METEPTLSEIAAVLNRIRWANTTPEQRKAATAKAREARKRKAAERRVAAANGGADDND